MDERGFQILIINRFAFSQEQVIIRSVFKKFKSRQKNRYIQIKTYARKQIYATKSAFFPLEQAILIRITYDTTSPFCLSTTTKYFIPKEIRFEMNYLFVSYQWHILRYKRTINSVRAFDFRKVDHTSIHHLYKKTLKNTEERCRNNY